jgi:hypothetical protein
MNETKRYLILLLLMAIMFFFVVLRLNHIEKLRCEVWRWEVCGELMK